MSRNGQGIYSLPAVYDVSDGDISAAAQITTPLEDLESDANNARPVAAGGTGATTAAAARANLGVYSKTETDSGFAPKAGGTFTGGVTIAPAAGSSTLTLNKGTSGYYSYILGQTDGNNRWYLYLGDNTAESGDDAGSDFGLYRSDDDGNPLGRALTIYRATGGWVLEGATGGDPGEGKINAQGFEINGKALSGTGDGEGANLIGVEDADSNFTGTTVETVLAELAGDRWTELDPKATTSGTAIDFTGLPSGLSEIEVFFDQVSTDGTDNILVQLGVSGSPVTTNYVSRTGILGGDGVRASTAGMIMFSNAATDSFLGKMSFYKITGDVWIANHVASFRSNGTGDAGGGRVDAGGTVDMLRLTTDAGTATFDAGSVRVRYR